MTREGRHRRFATGLAGASLAALLLAACAAALPNRLYTLTPAADTGAQEAGAGPVLGLGPVSLPDYLDRPEIVTRTGDYGVRLGEFDKWAEPLEPMFLRLLAERLRRETGSREVVLLPSRRETEPASAVEVEIDRFDAGEGGEVVLDARWRVRQTEGGRTLRAGRSLVREQGTPVPGYDGIVAAMSRAVDGLAREIGAAVPRSGPSRPPPGAEAEHRLPPSNHADHQEVVPCAPAGISSSPSPPWSPRRSRSPGRPWRGRTIRGWTACSRG
jgi:uncharacterized lipoprotein YmbA